MCVEGGFSQIQSQSVTCSSTVYAVNLWSINFVEFILSFIIAVQGWRKQFHIGQANSSSMDIHACVESRVTYRI